MAQYPKQMHRTIADLQRQRQQAQEELSAWHQEFTVTLDNGKPYTMDALEAGKTVQDAEAEARMAQQDKDAAIERGKRLWRFVEIYFGEVIELEERSEAAERDVATLQQDVGRAEQELELANRDAEGQRALAKDLAHAVVGTGYDREHRVGWRCKLCHAGWLLNTEPHHEDDCVLAPAEAQGPQGGQKEAPDA